MLYRTILLMGVAWLLITGIILTFLVAFSWLGMQRLEPISRPIYLSYRTELDSVHDVLAERLILPGNAGSPDRQFITEMANILENMASSDRALAKKTPELLRRAATTLRESVTDESNSSMDQPAALALALTRIRKALRVENSELQTLLRAVADYDRRQFTASVILAIVIPVATAAFVVFFRRKVLAPLHDLTYLMGLLARKDYTAAMTDVVDSMMAPLFEKYNRMVRRMRDLDQGHAKREDALQQDVDEATRALIQQQAALVRAERMAAVGDVSARLAHDLRNPLSGVHMALTNLRSEVGSAEQSERLEIMIEEIERIVRLLNNLVEESRQVSERPQRLQLSRVVDDLIKLLRYQLDKRIIIKTLVPEDIYCRLPDSGFRHVLLNLVMNAAQAIGEESGTIEITASVNDGHVELLVSDNGPGFPEELLKVGVHEHGTWRKSGTGIGLATARRFALAHGSRLELKSREQGGATVVLILPVEDCD